MAQAVGPRSFRIEALFRNQASRFGICGGQSGTGTGFIRVIHFSPVRIIPSTLRNHFFSPPKQPHDDLEEKGGCWKLKEEALDRTHAELCLKKAVDLSSDRLWSEWISTAI